MSGGEEREGCPRCVMHYVTDVYQLPTEPMMAREFCGILHMGGRRYSFTASERADNRRTPAPEADARRRQTEDVVRNAYDAGFLAGRRFAAGGGEHASTEGAERVEDVDRGSHYAFDERQADFRPLHGTAAQDGERFTDRRTTQRRQGERRKEDKKWHGIDHPWKRGTDRRIATEDRRASSPDTGREG